MTRSAAIPNVAIPNVTVLNVVTRSVVIPSVTVLSVAVTEVRISVQIVVLQIVVFQTAALISVRNAAFAFRLDQLWVSRAVVAKLAPVLLQVPVVLCVAQVHCAE